MTYDKHRAPLQDPRTLPPPDTNSSCLHDSGTPSDRNANKKVPLPGKQTWGTLEHRASSPGGHSYLFQPLSLNLMAFHLGCPFPRGLCHPAFAWENRLQKQPASFSQATERICGASQTETHICRKNRPLPAHRAGTR